MLFGYTEFAHLFWPIVWPLDLYLGKMALAYDFFRFVSGTAIRHFRLKELRRRERELSQHNKMLAARQAAAKQAQLQKELEDQKTSPQEVSQERLEAEIKDIDRKARDVYKEGERIRKQINLQEQKIASEMSLKRHQAELADKLLKLSEIDEHERAKYDDHGNRLYKPAQPAEPQPEPPPQEPAASPYLTDRQVEALALKAVVRIGTLPPSEQDAAWEEWKREVEREYGPYLARELQSQAALLNGKAADTNEEVPPADQQRLSDPEVPEY